MTTEQAYNDFLKKLLSIYENREAQNITDWVFENITGYTKLQRRINAHLELEEIKIKITDNYLQQLLRHKPVQYVLNESWFYKMKFYVDENVLIPRPETEELVEWIIDDVRNAKTKETKIIDIGTGSGCIAISLKQQLPSSNITAIDISDKALNVAKQNAHSLNADINFLKLDFLDKQSWDMPERYDIIVSNPPYIPGSEKEKLSKNVTAYEPAIALFVDNNNPFIFYEMIAEFAQSHLKPNGKIFVEIHEKYSNEVQKIFAGYHFNTEIKKDIYGKERMIKAVTSIN